MRRKALFKKLLAVGLAATFALSSVSGALATEEPGTEPTTEAVSEVDTEAATEETTEASDEAATEAETEAVSETPAAVETAEYGVETLDEKGAPETRTVYVELFDAKDYDRYYAGEVSVTVVAWNGEEYVDVNTLSIMDGYQAVNVTDDGLAYLEYDYLYLEVLPVETPPATRDITVFYETEDGQSLGTQTITIAADLYNLSSSELQVPEGYNLAETGDINVFGLDKITVVVRPIQSATTSINVWMYDANDLSVVYCDGVTVEVNVIERDEAKYVDADDLPMMEGYTTADATDDGLIPYDESGYLIIFVTPIETPSTTRDITVCYETEDGQSLGTQTITIAADLYNLSSSELQVPEGYNLAETGDINVFGLDKITVVVRPIQSATTSINVWMYDANDLSVVYCDGVTVEVNVIERDEAKYVDADDLPMMEGYTTADATDDGLIPYDESGYLIIFVTPIETPSTTRDITVCYETEDGQSLGTQTITIEADLYNLSSSELQVPEGYELAETGDINVSGLDKITVVVRPVPQNTRPIEITYFDVETEKQVGDTVTIYIPADSNRIDVRELDIPDGYEYAEAYWPYVYLEEEDTWYTFHVRKVEAPSQVEVTVEYVDIENDNQLVGTETVMVDAQENNVNTSVLTNIPEGYELVWNGDLQIMDGRAYAEVRKEAATKVVGVNYYDSENNVQVKESTVTVEADAIHVNTSLLTDVPAGYELVWTGDLEIMDGWIYAEVRKVADTKVVGVNYYDSENNVQVKESTVTVEADAIHVNTSLLTDVPEGYELVWTGDLEIMDGWIYAEVRKVTTKTVGVNYYSFEEDRQIAESSVTVDADAVHVNTSLLTDVPEGYELVWTGDLQIMDGWVFAEVRKAVMTVNVRYYIEAEDKYIDGAPLTVSKDTTYINTTTLTDVPEGYEIVWLGDEPIRDGVVTVEIRAIETTKEVAVKYYIEAEDRTIDGQSVKADKDATYINTSILKDVPNGYELVWTGDLPIENDTVVVEIRAKKLDVDFVIADSSMGSFADTAYAGMTTVSFTDLEASTGTQYGIPAVKAAEGYVFIGWKDSTGAILWDAAKTTFEVVPGMGTYMEGAANGTLVLTAQFAPAETEPESTAPTEPETTPATEPESTVPTEPESTVPEESETPVSEPETTVDEPTDDGWDDGEEEETQAAGTETNESETKAAADAAEASADGSVKTGDETPLGLYASIMVLAAAVIIGVLAKVRRAQR